ncbi:phosphotransferase [Horticoccus sp. 23ND18S-11]|uniref:phosphotransferase n=1 Tax=Horticoccus sp. 23ND18S-11 TaxID=3391832 RepID=UPI0039C96B58
MSSHSTPPDLRAVVRAFPLLGHFREGAPFGSGHINDTFVVVFDQAGAPIRYLLQRVNHRIFTNVPALMDNIARVTSHAARRAAEAGPGVDVSRCALTLVSACDGRPYHRDADGGWWRCYLFIERARTYDVVESPAQAAAAARAFGEFQRLLVDLPGERLHETIPNFHHTRRRFEALQNAIQADAHNRAATAQAEIAWALQHEALVDVLLRLQERGEIPERVTHNDTKLNNVMLDDATQAGVCVIDLDTVMPGVALNDFGDMVRSGTNAAAEDECDLAKVQARLPMFEALVQGYLSAARSFLNPAEVAHLVLSGQIITFEIGIRFLTDYLAGDVYFKIKRPRHNLERAANQFALVRSLERQRDAMEAIVARHISAG